MDKRPKLTSLKDINAYKKQLCWGDIPTIYQMVTNAISDVDGILTHGFDSAYKKILNKNTWNLPLLGGFIDANNNIQVTHKPKISLRHCFSKSNYELHCYPVVLDEKVNRIILKNAHCPFESWYPEETRMLFRINNLVSFIIYTQRNGDEADKALIKYAFYRVSELIKTLSDAFNIIDINGFTIADFYQEISQRTEQQTYDDLINLL